MLTINLTKSYNKCPVIITSQEQKTIQNTDNQDRPSKFFDKMFNQSDVWMGYADFDTKTYNSKLY